MGVDVGEQLPSAVRLEQAFDDPAAIRRLVEVNGPFASIASYLPASATGVHPGGDEPGDVLPWFRSNWVVNGRCTVDGANAILDNRRFIDAACRFLHVDGSVDGRDQRQRPDAGRRDPSGHPRLPWRRA
jgi:hypothetical protein